MAKEKAEKLQHTSEILQWRMQRIEKLKQPDGWLSLVGMHWLPQGITRVGSGPANGTRINVGPKNLGLITTKLRSLMARPRIAVSQWILKFDTARGVIEITIHFAH